MSKDFVLDPVLRVLHPGVLTTVQDRGRYGYQKLGVPVAGVMDEAAYDLANALVGNSPLAAVLEMTLYGGSYRLEKDVTLAVTGADMQPKVNGESIGMNRAVLVRAGSELSLGAAVRGCRSYLAVRGGIEVPVVMGSRSTYRKCGIGGYLGRELKAGDEMEIGNLQLSEDAGDGDLMEDGVFGRNEEYHSLLNKEHPEPLRIHVLPGPQEDRFTAAGIRSFYEKEYVVSSECDRMGCRLEGPAIESKDGTDILSDGIVFGSIQVTGSGMPIVLMADHQTTGGYAKIATVIRRDLPLLAQARPGTRIRFQRV